LAPRFGLALNVETRIRVPKRSWGEGRASTLHHVSRQRARFLQ
jgi:hypothetical protein